MIIKTSTDSSTSGVSVRRNFVLMLVYANLSYMSQEREGTNWDAPN